MVMKKGTVLFIKGDSVVSKIIRLLDGEYSHISIALTDDVILEAQRFTKSRIVKNEEVNYDALELTLTDEQLSKLTDSALKLIGYDYDYRQIFSTLLHLLFNFKRKNNKEKFICSELIVRLLYDIDYLTKAEYKLILNSTPNELYRYLVFREETLFGSNA